MSAEPPGSGLMPRYWYCEQLCYRLDHAPADDPQQLLPIFTSWLLSNRWQRPTTKQILAQQLRSASERCTYVQLQVKYDPGLDFFPLSADLPVPESDPPRRFRVIRVYDQRNQADSAAGSTAS